MWNLCELCYFFVDKDCNQPKNELCLITNKYDGI